jgi:hypothetical protein
MYFQSKGSLSKLSCWIQIRISTPNPTPDPGRWTLKLNILIIFKNYLFGYPVYLDFFPQITGIDQYKLLVLRIRDI